MKTIYSINYKFIFVLLVGLFITATMVSANGIGNNSDLTSTSSIEVEVSIEDWMVDLTDWSILNADLLEELNDLEIEVEQWMISASSVEWNTSNNIDLEEEMAVEDWMINLKAW